MEYYTRPTTPKRPGMTLFFLWTAFLIYTAGAFALLYFSFGTAISNAAVLKRFFAPYTAGTALLLGLLSVGAVMCCWCVALLIKGRRWAFFILLLLTLACAFISFGVFDKRFYTGAGFVGAFLITTFGLPFSRDGKSAWSMMSYAFDWAHCRHLNIVYFVSVLVFAGIGAVAVTQAPRYPKSSGYYDDLYDTDDTDYYSYGSAGYYDEPTYYEGSYGSAGYDDEAVCEEPACEAPAYEETSYDTLPAASY